MFKLQVLTIFAIAVSTYAYSGGAPEGTCDDMKPQHPVDPQTSEFPYKIDISKKKISPGDTVDITIGTDKAFKGFLLQVRKGDKAIGQFLIPEDDKFAKILGCHGGKAVSIILLMLNKIIIWKCNILFRIISYKMVKISTNNQLAIE